MKRTKKIMIFALIFSLLFMAFPSTNVEAASKVKINKTKQTLYLGKTTTLKISGTSKKVTWKTSNKKVATVNSKGKVTTQKAGTAVISGKVKGKTYKCKITVKNPYLNKTKVSLNTGKSYTLKITGATAKKWTSSNPKIVKVSSKGVIKGLKKGTAKITCTSSNGKKYSTNVTVKSTTIKTTCSHSYVWETTKEATCTVEGERRYICSKCKTVSKTEKTNKLSHDYDWDIHGDSRIMKCVDCKKTTGPEEVKVAGVWGYYDDSSANTLFYKVNETRNRTGSTVNDDDGNVIDVISIPSLIYNSDLANIAKQRAAEVASNFSHDGLKTSSECLAEGYKTAINAKSAWIASSDHFTQMIKVYYITGATAVFYYDNDNAGHYTPYYVLVMN